MSRSFKKPYLKEGYGGSRKRFSKNQANREVRQRSDIPSGGAYRKIYNPWDICDWIFYCPEEKKARRK